MSIEQEITRLVDAKAAFKSWLTAKGVSVPKEALLPSMPLPEKTIYCFIGPPTPAGAFFNGVFDGTRRKPSA